jgi:hypothetical protein
MAITNSLTVGANLKPIRDAVTREFSLALMKVLGFMRRQSLGVAMGANGSSDLNYQYKPDSHVFMKAGVPSGASTSSANDGTAGDSPGQNLCFIIDTTNNDLYLVYAWSSSTQWQTLKILG